MEPYIDPNGGGADQPGGASITVPNPLDMVVKKASKEADQTETVDGEKVNEQVAEHLEQQAKEAEEALAAAAAVAADAEGVTGDSPPPEAPTDLGTDVTAVTPEAAYDPSAQTVPQVLAYIEAHPDERQAVLDAERADKARKTILEAQ